MPSEADVDPFDSLLSLEDQYYSEGYELGVADGSRAGRIEGRVFGLEKGFEKFVAMGKLHGRAVVWNARSTAQKELGKDRQHGTQRSPSADAEVDGQIETNEQSIYPESNLSEVDIDNAVDTDDPSGSSLLPLPRSQRLERHIDTLHALTEPATFSTQNDEDSVADFDERLKRAEAKTRLIVNMLGEDNGLRSHQHSSNDTSHKRRITLKRDDTFGDRNIEDFGKRSGKNQSDT